jgi:branched-chain amino acid transport system substrate-binding protein
MRLTRTIFTCLSAACLVLECGLAVAGGQYGPGVSDTEIKIGNTMPYSGPASSYGAIGQSDTAYFAMINERGGVNGRKINFISRDDAYSPPKTVEQVRKLVEQDQVLLLFNTFGTPPNTAIQNYLNDSKVPQLFAATGANKWNDPRHYPWTMGWPPSDRIEARIWARYILDSIPDAKIAVLYQNDDFGKDYLIGLRDGLGDKADKMVVATQSYETTDATIDSQIVTLHGGGTNVLLTAAIPKFSRPGDPQSLRYRLEADASADQNIEFGRSVMRPVGPEKAVGIISETFLKDPTDPQWQDTAEYKEWLAWMKKYNTTGNVADALTVYGYSAAQTMVAVLQACGDNLTRENVMKQAASIHDLKLPMLLPGITISTSADDFAPIKQMQFERFDGNTWQLFGEVLSGSGK